MRNSLDKVEFKKQLRHSCISILERRIEAAREAMQVAQQAANNEGKSTAGDKYETSRAMGQLDTDMNAKQLDEAMRDLAFIHTLTTTSLNSSISPGSVAITEQHRFFIALGLGTVTVNNEPVVLLSPNAPVARMLEGKKAGEKFLFNGQEIKILDVF